MGSRWCWWRGQLVVLALVGLAAGAARTRRDLRELKQLLSGAGQPPVVYPTDCDFEAECSWRLSANDSTLARITRPPIATQRGPTTDASYRPDGTFLWMLGPNVVQIQSKMIPRPRSNCYLEVALHQVEMKEGLISLVIETYNRTTSVAVDRPGNDNATWEKAKFNLGGINQRFRIMLEMTVPRNASIALDNIRLMDCFPDSRTLSHGNCTYEFRCNDGACLKRDHVCDLTPDCADAEDETRECDMIPKEAMCNFERGWCGWENVRNTPLTWTLYRGLMPVERMGPEVDHTYHNVTGTYAYVNMTKNVGIGSQATMNSPIFYPPPPYHSDAKSPYHKSCKVRFFHHRFGPHVVAAGLYVIQLKALHNHTQRIWWKFNDKDNADTWQHQLVSLPTSISDRYFLQFEASKGYASKADFAIDDFSLSPECFGVGVPEDVVGDYKYYDQNISPWDLVPPKHADFNNDTMVRIGTCGLTGRFGPTHEQCAEYNSGTDVEVLSDSSRDEGDAMLRSKGIQRWIAPAGGYYTVIAQGAGGGSGALGMGITLGARVRGVIELEKGQQLYFMIGQPGTDACPKSLGSKNSTCTQPNGSNSSYISAVHEVRKIELRDGGGGGGGATYVFTLKPTTGEQQPLLIAGGGGGLGPTQFFDDGVQHAKGHLPDHRNPFNGASIKKNSGGGGGWLAGTANESSHEANGMALSLGGIGGVGCGPKDQGHGNGGFGGGGGGCLSGGGGGGYAGGNTGHGDSGNGEGGYSFVSSDMLHAGYEEKVSPGPGVAFIIPAIQGCGCDFRCVVVDQHLSDWRCLCPPKWHLSSDGKQCLVFDLDQNTHKTYMIIMVGVCCIFVVAVSCLFLMLYNRYQARRALKRRRQVMFGNGTELTTLRVVSDSMMTEFNPNYEFAGNLYNFKDLPQIPRESINMIKPLGQGAFGEVYQGIYKYRRNEEYPVAVKTLPSLTTSHAEADFMMEALIMSKFDHPNIVRFIGISFDKHPRYIVLELLAGGDLKNFLREERPRPDRPTTLTMQCLVNCAFDVAKGCRYLEESRFIHRDIAARNCLLSSKGPERVVKIADFGMARDIYRSDYYKKGGKAMLPIKWMPPESFLDGMFSTKTDVWAFGVLLWEIMSFGYMPYTGCANREVMSMVTSGGRLEKPAGCPDPIYGIMLQCWHPHPDERPSFTVIVERMGYCLQDPDVINHPTPDFDVLPLLDREITIMRPDPETECINVHADLDGHGYMKPRAAFQPSSYRIGHPPKVVYASLRHGSEDQENRNNLHRERDKESSPREHYHRQISPPEEHDLDDVCDNRAPVSPRDEPNANVTLPTDDEESVEEENDAENNAIETKSTEGRNGNGDSTNSNTDTNSDSLFIASSGTPPDTASSSPNTRTSSPNHVAARPSNGNSSPDNVNGIVRKNALKAALSLDPSALCRDTIPYEKIAFSQKQRPANPPGNELRKESLSHELPREECSC